MKLVRSWPAEIPEGRAYVVDDIPKFVMGRDGERQFDYRGLVDLNDDVVLIEWDIAIGGAELALFMKRAKKEPDRVRVAPYFLYRGGRPADRRGPGVAQIPFYCHRIRDPGTRSWVRGPEDKHCNLFGFGLVYLPAVLLKAFVAQMDPASHFGDTEFSKWHMRNAPKDHRNVPIDWDCHAVHLHYNLPGVP
jgi:hypothetical protein